MKPIAHAVVRALHALGVDRDVARVEAIRVWPEVATRVLGRDAELTHAVRAEEDTLVIAVPTAHWAGEIRLRERELLAALRERAPASAITRLRPTPASTPRT